MSMSTKALVVIGPGYDEEPWFSFWETMCAEDRLGSYGSGYQHYKIDPGSNIEWDDYGPTKALPTPGTFGTLLVMGGSFASSQSNYGKDTYEYHVALLNLFNLFKANGNVIAAIGNGIQLPIDLGVLDDGHTLVVGNQISIDESDHPNIEVSGAEVMDCEIPHGSRGSAVNYRVISTQADPAVLPQFAQFISQAHSVGL